MLEDTTIVCPFCNMEIYVKVMRVGKKDNYIVAQDCPNCKESSSKIERALNRSRKNNLKFEKSYIKLGMKDRK